MIFWGMKIVYSKICIIKYQLHNAVYGGGVGVATSSLRADKFVGQFERIIE